MPGVEDDVPHKSQTYADKQARLVTLIDKSMVFVKGLLRNNPEDKFGLRYPTTSLTGNNSIVCTPISVNRGANGRATPLGKLAILSPSSDILRHDLDDTSLARILAEKLAEIARHLERLRQRACDKTSRILITGDVNAGKSTFVNALLGTEVLPTDQQPCTQSFCEIIPTSKIPSASVHAIKDISAYLKEAAEDVVQLSVAEMQEEIQQEDSEFTWYRLFWPVKTDSGSKRFTAGPALDVTIIDSPGLNSDLFKTASLFSRQADIDVVVFLVNAANHLTLSAREFLEKAAKEKDYIFVVVNRFDDIKNKEKCRRTILQQISEILPRTHSEAQSLIHFVSAVQYLREAGAAQPEFEQLEACLREFILDNRLKSKLLPIATFLKKLAADLDRLLAENCSRVELELDRVQTELEMISPCYDDLVAHDLPFRSSIQAVVNETCEGAYSTCLELLSESKILGAAKDYPWEGIFGVWSFRRKVIDHAKQTLLLSASEATGRAKQLAADGLYTLNSVAATQAPSVFSSPSDMIQLSEVSLRVPAEVTIEISDLAPWDIVDWSHELTSAKTWFGASAIGAAFFGYRPLLSIGLNALELLSGSSRRSGKFLLTTAVLATGAVAIGMVALDLESMVRRRVLGHLEETMRESRWATDQSRALEKATRDLMVQASIGLVTRFEEAINQQRRLRAEKDMERRQSESVLEHFKRHRSQLGSLRAELESFQLS